MQKNPTFPIALVLLLLFSATSAFAFQAEPGSTIDSVTVVATDGPPASPDVSNASDADPETGVDWMAMTMGVLGGLVIFLIGVERLADAFSRVGDKRIKRFIDRFTSSVWTGVLTGAVACTVLDSSSATIIMVIAMIRGGLLTFEQSLGLVMGANIGTTIGAQIIALDIFGYAPLFLLAGFLLTMLAKKPSYKTFGVGLVGAGMIFFGLGYLEESVVPLRNYPSFLTWVESLGNNPGLGAITGGLVTVVIQSSSATVGIAIVMAKAELISIRAGVAVMLGAEIGTVSNTLVASFGRGREAIRCAVFHLFFNLSTVIVGLLLIGPLITVSEWFAPGDEASGQHIARAIANAQVIFNVVGVLAFIGFIPKIAQFLYWLIPSKPEETGGETAEAVTTDAGSDDSDEGEEVVESSREEN